MTRASGFVVALALLAACERPGNPEQTRQLAGKALSGTLAYPRSAMVSVSAGDEAAQLVMSSPDSVSVVAGWFLRALPLNGWDVKRTMDDHAGTVTIYAEHGKRPLWLTLRPNVGGPGTTYTMIGVIPTDSTQAKSP
ncbi:MAG TPA: hypothetical protein VGQ48_12275 [Gemmatimonadales bacterium]|jgi:hypothetical protein|nr:hypothetical protein [Gemmatimonadales bacterium]